MLRSYRISLPVNDAELSAGRLSPPNATEWVLQRVRAVATGTHYRINAGTYGQAAASVGNLPFGAMYLSGAEVIGVDTLVASWSSIGLLPEYPNDVTEFQNGMRVTYGQYLIGAAMLGNHFSIRHPTVEARVTFIIDVDEVNGV